MKYSALATDENASVTRPSRRKSRWKYMLVLGILLNGIALLIYIENSSSFLQIRIKASSPARYLHHHNTSVLQNYTINTEGCAIPLMDPFDETVKQYYRFIEKNKWACKNMGRSFLNRNKTHIWVAKENLSFYNLSQNEAITCCYQKFYRPDSVDNVWSSNIDQRIKYEKTCTNFTKSIKVKDEFVKVTCYAKEKKLYTNQYLFAIKKNMMLYDDNKEIKSEKSAYNIIILGIDNVSRMNFHRTMPKTLNYLKSKGVVELLGYTKVGSNSYPNIIAMLTGTKAYGEFDKICYPHSHATFDFCPFAWTWYKKAGYYTALAEDTNSLGTFTYLADGFFRTPTDYYMHPFTLNLGGSCVKETFFYEVLLEYVEDIMWTLKSSKLFGFFWSVSLTHDDLNAPTVIDDGYLDFFKRMDTSNYTKNTIIFLLSDHGMRWGGIRSTKQGRLEENLPFVFILTPASFEKNYSQAFNNMKINAKCLTTPFDIHATLMDLKDLENIKEERLLTRSKENYSKQRGISLFLPIPGNRTCELAGIDEDWCSCIRSKSISRESKEASGAAKHLIEQVNSLLRSHPECMKLKLEKILSASEVLAGKTKEGEAGWREFLVMVQASPGGATFEGRVWFNGRNWIQSGMISRTNLYNATSNCVFDPRLRLYCYCK